MTSSISMIVCTIWNMSPTFKNCHQHCWPKLTHSLLMINNYRSKLFFDSSSNYGWWESKKNDYLLRKINRLLLSLTLVRKQSLTILTHQVHHMICTFSPANRHFSGHQVIFWFGQTGRHMVFLLSNLIVVNLNIINYSQLTFDDNLWCACGLSLRLKSHSSSIPIFTLYIFFPGNDINVFDESEHQRVDPEQISWSQRNKLPNSETIVSSAALSWAGCLTNTSSSQTVSESPYHLWKPSNRFWECLELELAPSIAH